jgi:DNA ligase-associated metallophosphoesterase
MRARGEAVVEIAGTPLLATADGALVWPEESLLVVADLHLEKGSSYAARRVFLPPYDTAATLARLAQQVARFAPRRLIFLGDTFHDSTASARVCPRDREVMGQLLRQRDAIWIAGNHDPAPPAGFPGAALDNLAIGPLRFRHEPSAGARGEIAGHLHPVARVATRGRSLRRRCFAVDGSRAVLPAFGAFTGGLNVRDTTFAALFPGGFTAHLMGERGVFAFPRARCLGD